MSIEKRPELHGNEAQATYGLEVGDKSNTEAEDMSIGIKVTAYTGDKRLYDTEVHLKIPTSDKKPKGIIIDLGKEAA